MVDGAVMPTVHRGSVGMEFIPNLLPGKVVDIAVTQHHTLIGIGNLINNRAYLLFQFHKVVDFVVDFILQLHNLKNAAYKRGIRIS